jgi:hypothetical protein
MATAMFAETLDNFQQSTRLIPKKCYIELQQRKPEDKPRKPEDKN